MMEMGDLKVGKQYVVKVQRPISGDDGDVLIYAKGGVGLFQGRSSEVSKRVHAAKKTQPKGDGYKAFFLATLVATPSGYQWRIDDEAAWQPW
jgi:hypothetical protein